MIKLILVVLIISCTTLFASGDDDKIIWTTPNSQPQLIDFTPDDKNIVVWTNEIQLWNAINGQIEFSIPTEVLGDFNYNEQYIVFAQDSSPKLLDWKNIEVVEGFDSQSKPFGRIRTAKSRNEFMAQTIDPYKRIFFKDKNTIYIWDIDTKEIIDSIVSLNIFDKGGYRWGRKTIDYDYMGESDEFVIIKYADNNSYEITIEKENHKKNTFYHIYNIHTKELLDSIFIFQSTFENNGEFIDKMHVMKNRTKIAWIDNNRKINFYNINPIKYESSLYLNFEGEVEEMIFSDFNNKFYISRPNPSKYLEIYDYKSMSLVKQYIFLKHIVYNRIAFNSNNNMIAFSGIDSIGNGIIALLDASSVKSKVDELTNYTQTTISPNPTSNFVNIDLNCSGAMVDYQINDVNGAMVAQSTIANQSGKLQLDFSAFASGVYFLTINCNAPKTYKIIKE